MTALELRARAWGLVAVAAYHAQRHLLDLELHATDRQSDLEDQAEDRARG